MTGEGYEALDVELKRLKTEQRPAVIAAISEARSHGDLSENAEYHAAKDQQGWIESRIAEIEDKLARAQVIDVSKLSGSQVKFGATVTVVDEDTEEKSRYQIVGEHEADVKSGRISLVSPLSRAMIGKEVG
ncbi:MAG: transcription elongation factor GreA, partial [Caulobacteraceae bacterium]|nr:transcription elongation factor GreA [Caulobacteraceae bacterium]